MEDFSPLLAAFEAVDHTFLFRCLESGVGIRRYATDWFFLAPHQKIPQNFSTQSWQQMRDGFKKLS